MFDFLPKSWNLWLNVECSLIKAGDHGELDRLVNRIQGDLDVKLSSYAKLGVWFRRSRFQDRQRRSNLGTVAVSSMDVATPKFVD